MNTNVLRGFILALLLAIACAPLGAQAGAPSASATASVVKQLGAIHKISGADLSLVTDEGTEVAVKIEAGARILRFARI